MLTNLCVLESQIWQDVARHQCKHVASQQLIHAAIELPDDDCYDSVVSHLAARILNFSALFAVHMSDDHDDDLYGDLQVSSDTVLAADVSLTTSHFRILCACTHAKLD
jgi:hypothetical protein